MKMEKKLGDVNQMLVLDPQNQNLRAQSRQLKNDITKHIESRRFKLTTKKYYCTFCSDLISSNDIGLPRVAGRKKDQQRQRVAMVQFPLNVNDATTAHKLQGSSKSMLVVNNWFYSHGWVYTVLSRVRILKSLFLMKPLEFKPFRFVTPRELSDFDLRMDAKILERARRA